MKSLIYHTDEHGKATPPVSRRDDFFGAILGKIRHAGIWGNERGVPLRLLGGDLWDKAVQNAWEINQMADALSVFKGQTWGIVGNHPIRGEAEEWMPYSGIRILERMGLIKILAPWKATIKVEGFRIRLHHAQLLREAVTLENFEHTTWADYVAAEDDPPDFVLVSDYHPQQGVHKIGKTTFVSPGALSRGALHNDNLLRKPAFAYLELDGATGKTKVELIEVPHAPAEVVFDDRLRIRPAEVQRDEDEHRRCIEQIRDLEQIEVPTPREIIQRIAPELKVSKEAIRLAIERVEKV